MQTGEDEMRDTGRWSLAAVPDARLEQGLASLLKEGTRTEVWVVAHLAEIEARGLHLRLGYESMFQYCLEYVRLGDFEAFLRLNAARLARSYPIIFDLLERQQLHLTALRLLRHYLTAANHRELLAAACNKSKRQLELLLVQWFPRADVPERLQRLPQLEPLAPGRYRLEVTIGEAAKDQLELARDLMSHSNPSGEWAPVIERAAQALVEQLRQRRFGERKRGASSPPSKIEHASEGPNGGEGAGNQERASEGDANKGAAKVGGGRAIGRPVKRAVVARDGLRCTFVGRDGRRCTARAFLQLDHVQPYACGGSNDAENVRVLCGAHNRLLAADMFGPEHADFARAK
jgi:hypothetical protein